MHGTRKNRVKIKFTERKHDKLRDITRKTELE